MTTVRCGSKTSTNSRIADSAILLVREDSGKSATEALRLDTLVSDLVDELRTLSFDVTLTHATVAIVRTNRTSLNRAFRNLIINAATHGKRGASPSKACRQKRTCLSITYVVGSDT